MKRGRNPKWQEDEHCHGQLCLKEPPVLPRAQQSTEQNHQWLDRTCRISTTWQKVEGWMVSTLINHIYFLFLKKNHLKLFCCVFLFVCFSHVSYEHCCHHWS